MYKLTNEQEIKFEELYLRYQDKVSLALYKCNIRANNYDQFYSYAMEGFLQAFLILEAGDISEEDFPAFAFTNMKRKIIDEIRRVSRNRDIVVDLEEKYVNMSYIEEDFENFIVQNSLEATLNNKEKRIYSLLKKGASYKEITEKENISKTYYYNILSEIRGKCEDLLYK